MDKKYLIYLKRDGYAKGVAIIEAEPIEIIKEKEPEPTIIPIEKIPQFQPNFKTGKIDVEYIEYKPTEIEQERIKILKAKIAELEGKE